MKHSQSVFLDVRGLRYHCLTWGAPTSPIVVLLHGWMDVAASFQFLVDAMRQDWFIVAPDWRGYGLTDRGGSDSYWFPDYYADLDRILAHFSPQAPVNLVGHSMGGNVACIYAGVRPERIAKLVNLEGFGMAPTVATDAPRRYARWLNELAEGARLRDYDSFEDLARRLQKNNPRLTAERAGFLAQHWGVAGADGRVGLRGDPAHKIVNPILYQLEEARACWRNVTAPVLWIEGRETESPNYMKLGRDEIVARKACFKRLTEHTIDNAGHMLHHDQPEVLAQLLEEFLLAT